ncbi:hypothetical protein [Bradyrhizobium sp. WSM3983]|uniref:hypothetical protein n=1 Tax=Bradyrhizobium sp. WSM3983 TaxID=1038867 RepID=UPI0012EBCEFC|nr:hypothetical protein [Bradyrhizobium sp. WSM3983]
MTVYEDEQVWRTLIARVLKKGPGVTSDRYESLVLPYARDRARLSLQNILFDASICIRSMPRIRSPDTSLT